MLMKGSLHTDEKLMSAIVSREGRPAHGTPHQPRVSDGCAHISQGAHRHRCRHQYCSGAGRQGGYLPERDRPRDLAGPREKPKVAILAAVETVSSKMPATIDAAALCKMAERRQITGGIVDGPLPFDSAISREAARYKGHCFRSGRRPGYPVGARSRSRKHSCQTAQLSRQCGQRRAGPGRASGSDSHQSSG